MGFITKKRPNLQIGVATVTCIAIWGGGVTELLRFGMKPESIPPSSFSQGVVNADCVAVWFCSKNVKMTMSPMAASMVSGLYTRPADPPTVTWEDVSVARNHRYRPNSRYVSLALRVVLEHLQW